MQQLARLAPYKTRILAAVLFALGALILASRWLPTATPASEASPADLAAEEAGFGFAEAPLPEAIATPMPVVIVYISGAVRAPDVYQLPAIARLKDLVLAAGGFSADADAEQINLASLLQDGQHIHIPQVGEAASAESPASPAAGDTDQIDINSASAAELDALDGIGQALAERIVEYRSANGPFKAIDDLRNVKGIGAALFAKIAPQITAGGH